MLRNQCPGILLLLAAFAGGAHGATLPGQVAVDPSTPTWFVRDGVGPLFLCGPGDPEGFLYRGTRNSDGTRTGDQSTLIAKLTGTGANCVYLMAVRSHGGDGDATENPFEDHDPSNAFDADVLDQWDGWFDEMAADGIVVLFIFYDDGASIWDTGDDVDSDESAFLTQIVDRFEHQPSLIWCVAEEYQEAYSIARVENIAEVIRAADDHDHPIAVHQHTSTHFHFADHPDIDQFAMQLGAGTPADIHASITDAWSWASGRYQLNFAELVAEDPRDVKRQKMWACAMGGAYVMVISTDLETATLDELEDCGRLAGFLESTPLGTLAPHDELAHAGTEYVLASPGESYVAYAANFSGSIGIQDMTAGRYTLRWFDCATGTTVLEGPIDVAGGDRTFSPPPGFASELAVSIERDEVTGLSVQLEPSSWARIKALYRGR